MPIPRNREYPQEGISSNPLWKHGKRKNSSDSTTLRGSLVDNGGARITERGFLLSAKPNPKPGRKPLERPRTATVRRIFQALAIELKPGKKYYFRASATNAEGTGIPRFGRELHQAPPAHLLQAGSKPNRERPPTGGPADGSGTWSISTPMAGHDHEQHQLGLSPMESPGRTAGLSGSGNATSPSALAKFWTDKEIYPFLYHETPKAVGCISTGTTQRHPPLLRLRSQSMGQKAR